MSKAASTCPQCHKPLGDHTVTIAEHDRDTTAVGDWTLCSWACAHALTKRHLKSGRDKH